MIEVELKFEILSGEQSLYAALEALPGIRLLGERAGTDTYYDTPTFDGLQRAVFLRVRNNAVLELKFHEQEDPDHLYSDERQFPLNATPKQMKVLQALCARLFPIWHNAPTVEEMFEKNDLHPFVPIEKQRKQYVFQDMILCLDHVRGLGTFLEIETQCEVQGEVEAAKQRLQQMTERLNRMACATLRPVSIGYVELWLRQHLPQVYTLGKYQERDDVTNREQQVV